MRQAIIYDIALAYLTDMNDLVDFMVCKHYKNTESILHPSEPFKAAMREAYLRAKADDLLRGSTDFLQEVKEYILTDDSDYGKLNFAQWLENYKGGVSE